MLGNRKINWANQIKASKRDTTLLHATGPSWFSKFSLFFETKKKGKKLIKQERVVEYSWIGRSDFVLKSYPQDSNYKP